MAPLGPMKRRAFVASLRRLGFTGPYHGGKHQIMQRGALTLILPNPHGSDIDRKLLARLLHQAGIDKTTWESL